MRFEVITEVKFYILVSVLRVYVFLYVVTHVSKEHAATVFGVEVTMGLAFPFKVSIRN
jgi:hypothetical protein